jgi:hypothetical protein
MYKVLKQSLLALTTVFLVGSWSSPLWADVKNLDYTVQELEVVGMGPNADAALLNAGMVALEQVLQTLLQTEPERQAFAKIRTDFLAQPDRYLKRLKIIAKGTHENGGRYYKILYQVQVADLRAALEKAGIIASARALSQQLNFPTLMVYYKDPADRSTYAQWSVDRIYNFLLAHQFKVIDQKVMQTLQRDDQVLAQTAGRRERLTQAMALQARADFYMRVEIEPRVVGRSGDYVFVQSPVQIQAFESSSGTPFITRTYQRFDNKGQPEALAIRGSLDISAKAVIEESVAGVMPRVMEDLLRHWKDHVARGRQYRLVVSGLKASQQVLFEEALRMQVQQCDLQSTGVYLVRYSGVLGDLADLLEESLQDKIGLTLQKFDLGSAYFKVGR